MDREEAQRLARELLRGFGDALEWAALAERPEHRFLILLAWLNTQLERRRLGRIVIVGGFAAEFYTGGGYRTLDVDFVAVFPASLVVEELLRMLEAPMSSRGPVLGLGGVEKALDLVSSTYKPRFEPVRVEVDGLHVYIEAPEELILRYLREWKYWGTREAEYRVLLLLGVLGDQLDLHALRRAAREEGLEDLLDHALERLRSLDKRAR